MPTVYQGGRRSLSHSILLPRFEWHLCRIRTTALTRLLYGSASHNILLNQVPNARHNLPSISIVLLTPMSVYSLLGVINMPQSRITFALALLFAGSVAASELTVVLAPTEQSILQGETPRFTVNVNATGPYRVLNLAKRRDLKDNLTQPIVENALGPASVPRFISDTGPTNASDYINIDSRSSLTFSYEGFPFALSELPPDTYTVFIQYRSDWSTAPVVSNKVTLSVTR